jgi:hypothetical protein
MQISGECKLLALSGKKKQLRWFKNRLKYSAVFLCWIKHKSSQSARNQTLAMRSDNSQDDRTGSTFDQLLTHNINCHDHHQWRQITRYTGYTK